jgi:glycine/D-amino acid oxidase-like deaminating enzyme
VDQESLTLLSKEEALGRLKANNVLGGTFNPHCAAIHPAKLVRGLAKVVESLGVSIYEGTTVTDIAPGRATTDRGVVKAETVLLATEGFTPSLRGHRRDLVPMYSLMVATEPLLVALWERIGLEHRETFSDKRHLRIYGQRTADGGIAFGGRGAPYHFGSRVAPEFDRDARVHAMLRRILIDLLPALPPDVRFTHAWGGNLGVPRDWYPSAWLDPETRLGFAGGYVGDGVALSNVAGRALADLVLGRESELTRLPFVGRRSPRWEVEPLRWIGVNAVTRLFASADRAEAASGRPAQRASWFWRAIGH